MNEYNNYIFKLIWVVVGIIMLRIYAKRKSTIKSALFGMASGGAALITLHYFGEYIGFSPPLNFFNTMISLLLGIPGLTLIVITNYFF